VVVDWTHSSRVKMPHRFGWVSLRDTPARSTAASGVPVRQSRNYPNWRWAGLQWEPGVINTTQDFDRVIAFNRGAKPAWNCVRPAIHFQAQSTLIKCVVAARVNCGPLPS